MNCDLVCVQKKNYVNTDVRAGRRKLSEVPASRSGAGLVRYWSPG
jgi:hypothetical protein